jgi:hypothetical protein
MVRERLVIGAVAIVGVAGAYLECVADRRRSRS